MINFVFLIKECNFTPNYAPFMLSFSPEKLHRPSAHTKLKTTKILTTNTL